MFEKRFSEIRADGRTLNGTAIRYGSKASIGDFDERFQAGAFGEVSGLDVILNLQHQRSRPLARTGGGGLVLTDGPDVLRLTATLPNTRDADDALTLVRSGILRGLSLEFRADAENWNGNLRTVTRASLGGIGLVDIPAYGDSAVSVRHEIRRRGRGVSGSFRYNRPRTTRDRGRRRKRLVRPGAFDFVLQSDQSDRELQLVLGDYSKPLASRMAGTLKLTSSSSALTFRVDRLPDTSYVRDFRAAMASGAAVFGVDALYRIPPPDVVPNAVEIVQEPGTGVEIQVVNEAVLTALAIVTRPPRGNPGKVEIETPSRRPSRRNRKIWLL